MKAPIRTADRNIVFGHGARDVWAVYRIEMESYEGLTGDDKLKLWSELASFGYAVGADFKFDRVSRAWSAEDYVARARAGADRRHGRHRALDALLEQERDALSGRGVLRPELYLSVRLAAPEPSPLDRLVQGAGEGLLHPRRAWRELTSMTVARDTRALSEPRRREIATQEQRTLSVVSKYFDAERATTLDVQWLVRRAFCFGVGEPELDVHYRPEALVMLEGDEVQWQPSEADVLRLFRSPILVQDRGLRIRSERGDSYQALLTLGAMPTAAEFPGRQAELLYAPLDDVEFPVDVNFSALWVPNEQAAKLVQDKLVHANHILVEEAAGEHGTSYKTEERPEAARALQSYLDSDAKPPLLLALSSFRIGARTAEQRAVRVGQLKEAYKPVALHQPYGEQLRLFCGHFPGQEPQVPDFCEHLLLEQMAGMMVVAQHAVGAESGLLIAHTAEGSAQPVLADLKQASRSNRPPATLLSGTLGSGKTMLLQLLLYQAFLLGSRCVDIDPKGDHAVHRVIAEQFGSDAVEAIELGADARYAGLLDPLRIAPEGSAEDLAASFLLELLYPYPPTWRTAVKRAVKTIAQRPDGRGRHCSAVISELAAGDPTAREVADALDVYRDGGLAQLGFACDEHEADVAGAAPFTYIQIRRLPRPLPGTPRDELTEDQRTGVAVVRLLAAYAMHLMGTERARHKVLGFDEAWFLLKDATGRDLIEHLNRWGRSEFATPILVTHLASDALESQNLIGTRFVFGQETSEEAAAGLRMLHLDPGDEALRRWLLRAREGRGLMRDLDDRVAKVQIDLDAHPELLHALSTTPDDQPVDRGLPASA